MKRGIPWWHVAGMPLAYLLLSIALTWPLAGHLTTAIPSLGDSLTDSWEFSWIVHAALTDPGNLWNGNVFYPYPNTVTFGNPFIPQAILAAPILLTTGNPLLAHNLQTLLAFTLAGVCTYALAYRMTSSRLGSFVAGVLFSFSSYHFAHFHQIGVGAIQWLPLAFLLLDRVVERPGPGRALALAAVMIVAALSNWYYGYMLVPLLGVFLLVRLIQCRPARRELLRLGGWLGLAAFVTLAFVAPVAAPYSWVRSELGFQRSIENVAFWSAGLADYLRPHWDNWLYAPLARLIEERFGERTGEQVLFPGGLAILLTLVGLSLRPNAAAGWGGRAARLPWVAVGATALVLSLGPLLRTPVVPGLAPNGQVPLPYAWLMQVVPGLDAIRVTARFGVFVSLSLAVLAAFGVAALHDRLNDRTKRGAATANHGGPTGRPAWSARAFAVLVLGIAAIEAITPTVRMAPVAGTAAEAPAVYRWLATVEPDAAVIELPMVDPSAEFERYLPIYMHYATFHWRRLVNGQMTFYPPGFFDIVDEMARFPSDSGVDLLQQLGVDYVVVHTDRLTASDRERWANAAWRWPGVERVAAFDGDIVYRVQAAPLRADDVLPALTVRAFPATHFLAPPRYVAGAPAPAVIEIGNPRTTYYVGAPAGRIRMAACWPGPAGTVERVTLDALAPLVVPPGGVRVVGARIVSREPVGSCVPAITSAPGDGFVAEVVPAIPLIDGDGWWDLEEWDHVPTRWLGQQATVRFLGPAAVGLLRFEAEAFARDREVEVLVNGQLVATIRVGTRRDTYALTLPLQPGTNDLVFRAVEPADSPRGLGIAADPRELSINVQRVTLTAREG